MAESNSKIVSFPVVESPVNALDELLRKGAHQLLLAAVQAEIAEYLEARRNLVDETGRQLVVRNGFMPEREIQTPLGGLSIRQARVRDRRPTGERETFSSKILPPYLRRTKSMEDLIPWLYLKGVSTGDFCEALQSLLDRTQRACRRRPSLA